MTTEAHMSRTQAPQQEKPWQWEAHALQLEKPEHSNEDLAQIKILKKKNFFLLGLPQLQRIERHLIQTFIIMKHMFMNDSGFVHQILKY